MSRLVVDASVMVRVLVEAGPGGDRVRTALATHDLHAPELLDLETTSALRRLVRSGTVPAQVAGRALVHLARAPVLRYPHLPLVPRSWELKDNLTTYDAAYVALAELLDATLVTSDAGVATAPGVRCARTHLS